jgi:outer membrane protein assembly factor BamB
MSAMRPLKGVYFGNLQGHNTFSGKIMNSQELCNYGMRKIGAYRLVVIGFACTKSCDRAGNNYMSVQVVDTFRLPGIPSNKTLYFSGTNVYYESMDEPGRETFKCFSLRHRRLVWSKDVDEMGINRGAILSTGEYLVPILSDTVYLIDANGKARILKLVDRCKIDPLVYRNTFILQDRGVELKCYDAETLREKWIIKQSSDFTMSQPLLLDSNIIYVLDDKSFQSSNAANGKLNWHIPVADTLALHDLYGSDNDLVFILSTNLKREKQIIAINYHDGKLYWQAMLDSAINEFERDMVVNDSKIHCRGDSSVFAYSIQDGKRTRRYDFKSRIATNLVTDSSGNLLFGLEDNTLIRIDNRGTNSPAASFPRKLDRLYRSGDKLFLYSFPNLYSLQTSVRN